MSRLGIVCLIVFALALPASALTLNFEPKAVVAKEVTPGGSAVVFAVAIDTSGYVRERLRIAVVLRDDDGDGIVRHELEKAVPRIGVWGVADVTTGVVKLAARGGYGRLRDLQVEGAFRGDGTPYSRFEHELTSADILVVRPGEGAWTASATEGGDGDDDYPTNGKLLVPVNKLVPLTQGIGAPEHLQAGDVVVLIDGDNMSGGTITLTGRN